MHLQRKQLLNCLVHFFFRGFGRLQLTDDIALSYNAVEEVSGWGRGRSWGRSWGRSRGRSCSFCSLGRFGRLTKEEEEECV